MKLCYTAIFGKYDTLKEPLVKTPGWEYVCFTDQPLESKVWEIMPIDPKITVGISTDQRKARRMKIEGGMCWDDQDSIWFDASIQIKGNLDDLVKPAAEFDGMVLRHPHRSNVYQEAQAIIKRQKDSQSCVSRQMQKYQMENFIQTTPLVATGILYRKNNAATRDFSRIWWDEIKNHSHRDQLSFNYALQKVGVRFLVSSMNIYDKNNKYFLLHKHNK